MVLITHSFMVLGTHEVADTHRKNNGTKSSRKLVRVEDIMSGPTYIFWFCGAYISISQQHLTSIVF